MIKTYYGPMGSGKSEKLIEDYNKIYYKDKVIVFKPSYDTRYSNHEIVDRKGNRVSAIGVDDLLNIDKYFKPNTKKIFIDETNFFESDINLEKRIGQKTLINRRLKTINKIMKLASEGYDFYFYGLNLTAELKPYGMTPYLMAISDKTEKLYAECADCGNEAIYTYYVPEGKTQINIIGDVDYIALCPKCWFKRTENRKKYALVK